jgi:hypothetical protein
VDPAGLFVLPPAGAVQELQVRVQPWRSGSRLAFVSAVDVERCQLLAAWMVCLNAHRPVLSKVSPHPPRRPNPGSVNVTFATGYSSLNMYLLYLW